MNKILISLFLICLLNGCAYYQSILLLEDNELHIDKNISVSDGRKEESKKTRLNPYGEQCSRWYGDQYISPNKISYLEHTLSKEAPNQAIELEIIKFDTVEYCLDTAKKVAAIATASALAAAVGGIYYYRIPGNTGGDFFRLSISGFVNKKPFEFTGDFSYSDLSYTNFPSESSEYRERVKDLFIEARKYIYAVANVK